VSLFRSQHVPSRWLYPALLLLAVAAAAAFGRNMERLALRRQLELVLLLGCLTVAVDIGRESSLPMQHAFWMQLRPVPAATAFQQYERVPRSLQYRRRDYAPEAIPATMAGVGVIQCALQPTLGMWAPKTKSGRPSGMGARGREASDYRGEAFTASGVGKAALVSHTPNAVVVDVEGARRGDRLVLNQNFDAGWSVNGSTAEPYRDAISALLTAAEGRYIFRFWPRGLTAGLAMFVVSVAGLVALFVRRRRTS
jgi:hypothetical protein